MSASKSSAESPEVCEYEVERIVDKKTKNGKVYYLVKWKGFSEEENTWQDSRDCQNARVLIKEFEKGLSSRQNAPTSRPNSKEFKKNQKENIVPKKSATAEPKTTQPKKSRGFKEADSRKITVTEVDNSSGQTSIIDVSTNEEDPQLHSPERTSSITDLGEKDVEILGAVPENGAILIGVKKKNDKNVYTFPSLKIFERWPRLLLQFYEEHVQFDNENCNP